MEAVKDSVLSVFKRDRVGHTIALVFTIIATAFAFAVVLAPVYSGWDLTLFSTYKGCVDEACTTTKDHDISDLQAWKSTGGLRFCAITMVLFTVLALVFIIVVIFAWKKPWVHLIIPTALFASIVGSLAFTITVFSFDHPKDFIYKKKGGEIIFTNKLGYGAAINCAPVMFVTLVVALAASMWHCFVVRQKLNDLKTDH